MIIAKAYYLAVWLAYVFAIMALSFAALLVSSQFKGSYPLSLLAGQLFISLLLSLIPATVFVIIQRVRKENLTPAAALIWVGLGTGVILIVTIVLVHAITTAGPGTSFVAADAPGFYGFRPLHQVIAMNLPWILVPACLAAGIVRFLRNNRKGTI
jgi:hypothetical protein